MKFRKTRVSLYQLIPTAILSIALLGCGDDNSNNPEDLSLNVTTGSFTDPRDNQEYKTVTIGTQTWMAENLKYSFDDRGKNRCYDDSTELCTIYGQLYTWRAAQEACPTGWHLAKNMEWWELIDSVHHQINHLMSKDYWYEKGKTKGDDLYGFALLPAGMIMLGESYNRTIATYFWTTENRGNSDSRAYGFEFRLGYEDNDPDFNYGGILEDRDINYYSVRCIKDI